MSWNQPGAGRSSAVIVAACLALLLASCGNQTVATPSPSAPETPIIPLPGSEMTGTPWPEAAASPIPSELTVGDLADRISDAWVGVRTYRTTFKTTRLVVLATPIAVPITSPVASPIASNAVVQETVTIIDEVVLPDRRRRARTAHGEIVSEVIRVEALVYVRGEDVPGATPIAGSGSWLALDGQEISPGSPGAAIYDAMTASIAPPYSDLSTAQRGRIARPVGPVRVEERDCSAYRIADVTMTGERVDVVISLGDDDLPCSITTTVGGVDNVTVFEYNVPITIDAPV